MENELGFLCQREMLKFDDFPFSEHTLMNIHNDLLFCWAKWNVCKVAEFLIFGWKYDSAVASEILLIININLLRFSYH